MSGIEKNAPNRSRSLFYNNRAADLEKVKSDLRLLEDDDDDIDIDSEMDDVLFSGKSKGPKKRGAATAVKQRLSDNEAADPALPTPARKRAKLNAAFVENTIDLSNEADDDALFVVQKNPQSAPTRAASYLDFLSDKEIVMLENGSRSGLGGASAPVSGMLGYLTQTQNELRRSLSSMSAVPDTIANNVDIHAVGGNDLTVILEFANSNRAPIKIRILKKDKLVKVVQVAERLLNAGTNDTIVLKLKQGNIPLDPSQTPDDYELQVDEKLVVSIRTHRPPPNTADNEDAVEREVREKIEKELDHSMNAASATMEDTDGDTITLAIRVPGEEKPRQVRIKKTDKLEKIVAAFASKLQVPQSRVKLSFDGLVAANTSTPEDLDMEDEDLIDLKLV